MSRKLIFHASLIFSSFIGALSVTAASGDDMPLEDFPDFEVSEQGSFVESKQASTKEDDLPVESSEAEPKAEEVAEESIPAVSIPQAQNVEDFSVPPQTSAAEEIPADVLELEKRLQEAEGPRLMESEAALLGGSDGEPGSGLTPSEKFSRIPLRPPMSDSNWLRWAGPMIRKDYRIKKQDSLWAVSERLFGTPYLWPKVWHLNAHITNPHVVDKGTVLAFNPGNPNSAPELAYRVLEGERDALSAYPMTKFEKKLTLLEMIDQNLRDQIRATHPPFQYFMLDRKPKIIGKIPDGDREGRVFFTEGDQFDVDLPDGLFPVVRITEVKGKLFSAYRVRWLGNVKVERKRALLEKAYAEIREGDTVLNRKFQLSPLAIHEDVVGPILREDTQLLSLQEGGDYLASQHMMIGVRFPNLESGPRPGAILTLKQGNGLRAKALLVDRDQRVGTLWIIDSEKEVSTNDQIF